MEMHPHRSAERSTYAKIARRILATAIVGLALQNGPQAHAQAETSAIHPETCHTVMFHFPHSSHLPDQGYISEAQIADEEVSVAEAAEAFSAGLDPSLDFSSLHSTAIGLAEVCTSEGLAELTEKGASDVENIKMYQPTDLDVTSVVQGDEDYPDADVMRIMNPNEAWSRGATGADAGLAVVLIDTGVDTTHPALANTISPVQKCFSRAPEGFTSMCPNGKEEDDSAFNADPAAYHGTMMAGYIASVSHGEIIPIQATSEEATADGNKVVLRGDNLVRAYDYIIASNGRIAAVNASYGQGEYTSSRACLDDNKLEAELIQLITRKGIAFVTATGNEFGLNFTISPACLPINGLIAVGSSTNTDTVADHSDMAEWVKVLAPGEALVSTYPNNQFAIGTGTSGSTALVSGAVQVQRDIYRNGTPQFMEDNLIQTGIRIADQRIGSDGHTNGVVASRVDFIGIVNKWVADYIRANPISRLILPFALNK